ncbi:MAG: T9SS type A sorting domain-containing protein [Bacteroidetes bacterium]|nr:T9SS type A sorting domain-containing protein [Bacteroidota bacterium]
MENLIGEVNPLTGAVIQTFQISALFSVSYGDLEVGENGNLYVVSSVEDSILELTTQGQLVQMHDLPTGVSTVSGMDLNCGSAEVWVCSTNGTVYSLGASNCNTLSGIIDQEMQKNIVVFPNPSTGIFYFEHEMKLLGVFNVYGEMVLSANQHAKSIDLNKFSSGVYFLRTVDKGFVRLIKY